MDALLDAAHGPDADEEGTEGAAARGEQHEDRRTSRSPHPSSRTVALEIVHAYAFNNPSHIRRHIVTVDGSWIRKFCQLLLVEKEQPTQSLIAEVIKWCLDFDAKHNPQLAIMFANGNGAVARVTQVEREGFLTNFYDTRTGAEVQEARNTPFFVLPRRHFFSPSQETFHTFVFQGVSNISDTLNPPL